MLLLKWCRDDIFFGSAREQNWNYRSSSKFGFCVYSDSGLFTVNEQAVLDEAAAILKSKLCIGCSLAAREYEVFGDIFLDNQHRVRASEELFTSTVNATSVSPRVFRSQGTRPLRSLFWRCYFIRRTRLDLKRWWQPFCFSILNDIS